MSDLLFIENLVVEYPVGGGRHVHAVSDVTLSVKQGETLGLVGESGSGKSSLARALLQLPPPKAGAVVFDGQDLTKMRGQALRAVRPRLQMIFQDPIASLNPRRRGRRDHRRAADRVGACQMPPNAPAASAP